MSTLDWIIIAAYLFAVVGLGVVASLLRRKGEQGGEGGHYFLAGNTLGWGVIGLAMFAANISTVHLVSLAEAAYKFGLVFGNFEWMAGFTLILLSLFFAPLYLRSRVATLPDFLERRFNRPCRDVLAVISLFSAIVIHMGVALYTAAWVLRGILGLPPGATILGVDAMLLFIIALGLLTGIYTMLGGLLAVVWTESVQTVLLLVGAVTVTLVGYLKIGGWSQLAHTLATNPHPLAAVAGSKITWGTGNFLSMARSADDPSGLAWYSILLGYPVLGIWYWCCDQTIVQRVLAARDERSARLGPLFCAFLKIWPVFFFVLPGVICLALVQQNAFGGQAPQSAADTYTFMIMHLLPVGLKVLLAARLTKRLGPPGQHGALYQVESPEPVFAAEAAAHFLAQAEFMVTRHRPKEDQRLDLRGLVAGLTVLDPLHLELDLRRQEKGNFKVTDALTAIFALSDDQARELRILKIKST